MNGFLISILAIALFLSVTGCSGPTQISGEVFIVTAGAGNYKLGLVKVSAIPEKSMTAFFEQWKDTARTSEVEEVNATRAALEGAKQRLSAAESKVKPFTAGADLGEMEERHWAGQELDSARRAVSDAEYRLSKAERAANEPKGPDHYFESLPPGVAFSTTDSDGKYTLDIPTAGNYLVVAKASRKAGGYSDEYYYWAVWVTADGKAKQLTLSNNNEAGAIETLKR